MTTALVLFLFVAGQLSVAAPANNPVNAELDSIFAPLAARNDPGFAVLVRKDGRNVFERGCGVRDFRTLAKIDSVTNFRLASFTKQFTAMTIMLLVRDRKLRYDDRLTDLFPGFPAYGRNITVRHLLTHTSGLPDYEELMVEVGKERGPIWSAAHQIRDEEVLGLLKQQSNGKFSPGTSWAYSNSGYVLLGLVAAKISGKAFEQVLHDSIFEPLNMSGTVTYVNGENSVPHRAYGYTKQSGRFIETDQSSTSATLGDGGVYSNLTDLAKWDEALQKHTLLSETQMKAALTPVTLADGSEPHWPLTPGDDNLDPGKPVSYGFGWFLDPYQNRSRMWHTGTTIGFRTAIERFPRDGVTVVILCNRTDLDPGSLALQAADVILRRQ